MKFMNEEIKNIIKASSFKVKQGTYIYAKVAENPAIEKEHFMVSRDEDEITVVTQEDNIGSLKILEKNKDSYTLIALNVSVPFYSVGFLATVSEAIAKEGMNILIVSTYSKDYIMVKKDCTDKAKSVLLGLGFIEKS